MRVRTRDRHARTHSQTHTRARMNNNIDLSSAGDKSLLCCAAAALTATAFEARLQNAIKLTMRTSTSINRGGEHTHSHTHPRALRDGCQQRSVRGGGRRYFRVSTCNLHGTDDDGWLAGQSEVRSPSYNSCKSYSLKRPRGS